MLAPSQYSAPVLSSLFSRLAPLHLTRASIGRSSPVWRQNSARQSGCRRQASTAEAPTAERESKDFPSVDVSKYDHLNPEVPDFSSTPFTDSCTLSIHSGSGGHGCISFLREKFVANGPPNGGDGGTGGNVFVQAVRGETSLHKIARRQSVKAGRGRNGQGSLKGGKRGDDVILVVPVGTVVREIKRHDPVSEELKQGKRTDVGFGQDAEEDDASYQPDQTPKWRRDKWLLYPGALPRSFTSADFPALPRPRRSNLAATAVQEPIALDLDQHMNAPLLLAPGAMGGLGNPHFVTKSIPRPKYATKGDEGMSIQIQLELKLLADVGLVGMPNAGKSTLLRALTSSRARVGSWAFTTLAPNIGTVVLDSSAGPLAQSRRLLDKSSGQLRTHFTIADIPGLIEDAHLDKGLGLDFLRHIERASVLAFVIDLDAGDAVKALTALWTELMQYDSTKDEQPSNGTYQPSLAGDSWSDAEPTPLPRLTLPPIYTKPWLVVATKADLPDTQENFAKLRQHLLAIQKGEAEHPARKANAWRERLFAIPVCAMQKENTESVINGMIGLLGS